MQTGMPITSPFSGLNTIDDLSRLSYFEALACLGGDPFIVVALRILDIF